MLRSALSKVAWVGRTASMVFGLALVLALVVGVTSAAFGADGDFFKVGKANLASAVSTLTKSGAGPALKLNVDSGAPLAVNSTTKVAKLNADRIDNREASSFANGVGGVATNADKLDGKDSDEILPFVRAQKDVDPWTTPLQSTTPLAANTVSVDAPTDGFLVIVGSGQLANGHTNTQDFLLRAMLDGTETAGQAALRLAPNHFDMASYNVTVPVSAGEHTVTSQVYRFGCEGCTFTVNRNNLSVMFVPAARGAVTDTAF